MSLIATRIFDLATANDLLREKPYGMIEAVDGRFHFVQPRLLPKMISAPEVAWLGGWTHNKARGDRIQFFYNQPAGHRNYLTLKYAVSQMGTTLATLRAAFLVLDEVACIKRSDAILCEISNRRISDRIMRYWGFERHLAHKKRRHFIRRFYGQYPNGPPACLSNSVDPQSGIELPPGWKSAG